MLVISRHGVVRAERIKVKIFPGIERAQMEAVNGIVVHQTGAATIESTFHSYRDKGANGAHFLIDKDGTIYQTASLFKRANHVGLLKSRCLITKKCTPKELKSAFAIKGNRPLSRHEYKKEWPSRFPSNYDSIGIELVGDYFDVDGEEIYENVTPEQNKSLRWLINELVQTIGISITEIYRHPEISHKNKTEASSAKW